MADELPADAFYDLTRLGDPAVSPDGELIAYTAVESDPDEDERRTSVFVVPADGSRDPHRLTRASDAGSPTWSPDGSKLAVTMAREEDVELRVGRESDEAEAEGDDGDADASEGSDDADDGDDGDGEDDDADDGDDGDGEDDDADDGDGGDDEPKSQVWVYDLALGGDARQVTTFEEGVAGFDWGPDGERIVAAARDPTDDQAEYLEQVREDGPIEVERLQHKFDGVGWLDEVRTYLFVVDVESRDTTRLDDAYARGAGVAGGGFEPAWSPDGERIAFTSYRGDDPDDTYVQDVYTIAPDGEDLRRVTDGGWSYDSLDWSPDGDRIAATARRADNWYRPAEVHLVDPGTGAESLTADLDRTLWWGGAPRWAGEDRILALIGDEGHTRFLSVDPEGGYERTFPAQDDLEAVRAFDVAGGAVACHRSAVGEGDAIQAFDLAAIDGAADSDADPRVTLTDVNRAILDGYDQPGCRRVSFESEGAAGDDPAEIEAIAYYPPEFDPKDPEPHPFLLWIHGGPMAYDEPSWGFDDLFWTSRGYVVWKVNYRGSTSYGRAFSEVLRGRWNTVEVADLLAGVDAAVDRGWADPDRLFVGGFSQGGVNTGYLLTRTDRFAAAAAEHGIYDIRSSFGTDDSHNWLEDDFGLPWENPEVYDSASSITDVDDIETPTLVTAGENDWRCPPSQAEQFYVSIRKQGVPAKLVIYQDEHHDVGDPDRAIHRLETLAGWFEEHDPAVDTDEGDPGEGTRG